MIRKLLAIYLICFFTTFLGASDELYLLPKDGEVFKERLFELIKKSKKNIDISMYNFNYKKIAKALNKASKKGVKIRVVLDKHKVEKKDKVYKYLKEKGIDVVLANKKLHTKVVIFDKKYAILGSMNWKKESFKENYEVALIIDDKKNIKKLRSFIDSFY